MITGAHAIRYSRDADRDRAFLRDVLGPPNVDAGGGWLIFGVPPLPGGGTVGVYQPRHPRPEESR